MSCAICLMIFVVDVIYVVNVIYEVCKVCYESFVLI